MNPASVGQSRVFGKTWIVVWVVVCLGLPIWTMAGGPAAEEEPKGPYERHIYYNHGVHNDSGCPTPLSCVYERGADEPSDPWFPKWWVSDWTMYRVFKGFEKNMPPYASPPEGLTPDDYEISHGTTYYDSTYIPQDRDGYGAMMEHYDKKCLPIFPFSNDYTCSFVSLGNKAYFLTYDDRPADMPACCLFSPENHPPRRDFIRHLPYSAEDSEHLDGSLQAYSMTVGPMHILFGYAFQKEATPDIYDSKAAPYRHPQSFYFSGVPVLDGKPFAPIVSQNYEGFRMEQPSPKDTWDQVAQMCSATPPWCCLFSDDCPEDEDAADGLGAEETVSSGWNTLNPENDD